MMSTGDWFESISSLGLGWAYSRYGVYIQLFLVGWTDFCEITLTADASIGSNTVRKCTVLPLNCFL